MTILITGSTGKTSGRLARQLRGKQPVLIAGRSGKGLEDIPGVKFDWLDPSTHDDIFTHAQVQSSPITAVYLVAPSTVTDVLSTMQPFIEKLHAKGVRRFVLLSATVAGPGEFFIGAVHKYLIESGLEYTVLRPTWFQENYSEMEHKDTIRDQDTIFSATGAGKVPFISAEDIAAMAAAALTSEKSYDREFILLGPESLSHADIVKIFSDVLGREIKHVNQSEEDRKADLVKHGVPADFAGFLANLEADTIVNGKEDRTNNDVEEVLGRKPIGFKAFVEKNKQLWIK